MNRLDFELFFSCGQNDSDWVQGFLIPALGLPRERIIWNQGKAEGALSFRPGSVLADEYQRAVTSSRYTILVLSPAYLADEWTNYGGQLVSHLGISEGRNRLIPIMKEPCQLPLNMEFRVLLDCTQQELWEDAVELLRNELQLAEPHEESLPCPYPGMVPFKTEGARCFYGREDEVNDILMRLREQRLLWIIGPSGSGKSSLVHAGVLPRLNDERRFPGGSWLVRTMRPGSHPTQEIAKITGEDPAQLSRQVDELLAGNSPARRLLLVIDQFEEVYSQADRAEQSRFISYLNALRKVETCTLLITMRADFYGDMMNTEFCPEPTQRVDIVPLRGAKLRLAIQKPASGVGVYIESGLLDRLLVDAADEPGVLPLVQETMVLLWATMQRRYLALSAYEQMGTGGRSGLTAAIANKANATLAGLSAERQAIARRIFLRLVQFGEGRADTRRQQRADELASAGEPAEFAPTLDHLVNNRLLTKSEGDKGKDGREEPAKVDLSHEKLITGWPVFAEWVTERRESEKTRRRLEEKAKEWVRLGRGEGGLLDQIELADASQWMNGPDASDLLFTADLLSLVQKSREAIDEADRAREAARKRGVRLLAVSLVGVSVVLAIIVVLYLQNLKSRAVVETQRDDLYRITCSLYGSAVVSMTTDFRGQAKPLSQGNYLVTMFPVSTPDDNVSTITYYLCNDTIPKDKKIQETGRKAGFVASYPGWGRLEWVPAIIRYTEDSHLPPKPVFFDATK